MLSLLERNIEEIENRLVLLTPAHWPLPIAFRKGVVDKEQRVRFLRQMQRTRGEVYLRDGAIKPTELSRGGLHRTAQDERGWHLLLLDADQKVTGCLWYLEHDTPVAMDDLRIRACPLASDREWGTEFAAPSMRKSIAPIRSGWPTERSAAGRSHGITVLPTAFF